MDEIFSQFPTLQCTAADVITADELRAKLASGRPRRIEYGVDVTAPFLHVGHAVNLWAMHEMQQAGSAYSGHACPPSRHRICGA